MQLAKGSGEIRTFYSKGSKIGMLYFICSKVETGTLYYLSSRSQDFTINFN